VSPRNCGTELTPIQSHTSNRHFKYPPGIRRRKRDHPPKRIERLWHLMITTENPVPTRPLLLSVRNSTPARPSPSTHPTHSITNLLSKRTVTAKIISHQARHNTTTTIIHQPPPNPQHLILFDTIYISSTDLLLNQVETLLYSILLAGVQQRRKTTIC
jgi:hypothetical protein